jgi:hypothetical protein
MPALGPALKRSTKALAEHADSSRLCAGVSSRQANNKANSPDFSTVGTWLTSKGRFAPEAAVRSSNVMEHRFPLGQKWTFADCCLWRTDHNEIARTLWQVAFGEVSDTPLRTSEVIPNKREFDASGEPRLAMSQSFLSRSLAVFVVFGVVDRFIPQHDQSEVVGL